MQVSRNDPPVDQRVPAKVAGTWRLPALVGGVVLVGLIIGAVIVYVSRDQDEAAPEAVAQQATPTPALASLTFPTQPVAYPSEWPTPLRFPAPFAVVETNAGTLPATSAEGWQVKLRFDGTPAAAADTLTTFFESNGWQVARQDDAATVLLSVETPDRASTGIVIIEPADTGGTVVLATIRL